MILIQILLYMLLQFQQRGCAKLTGKQRVVFPELLESRSADGGKVLRITEDLTLNLEKSSILSKSFLLRTYDDRIMKHTYHDGEILEEDLYHDPKHLASVMVSEYNGIQVEGVLGPTLRIKPIIEQRTVEGRTAHVLYEIADDPNHNIANVGVQWREQANISERNDKAGSANVVARPELLAAVDSTFRSEFKSLLTLLKYIIIIFNSANVRYMTVQNPSVQLKLHALEVFDEYTETMFLYRVDGYLAAYRSLQTFRDYVSQNAHKYGEFDAVYLVTGLNMASYNGYGWNVDIQGIAFVAGACSHQKVGMGEDVVGTFFGVRIMSHEIGHLLGCPHDGDSFGQYSSVYCPWHQGFIMSYKVENSNSMKFSSCCQDNIRRFVESTGRCVLKLGPNGRISKDNYTKVLPGEYITKEKNMQGYISGSEGNVS
uniref:Reprolysin n=1 Tax=Rhipicephalus zambeziensis TaxID=60191 RepID=A0A224YEE2_9ACAR